MSLSSRPAVAAALARAAPPAHAPAAGPAPPSLATMPEALAALVRAELADTGAVPVRFWLKFHVEYGQSLRIVGGSDELGGWELRGAPAMEWSDGDLWNVSLELEAGEGVRCVCVGVADVCV
jgi:hypothetical protein